MQQPAGCASRASTLRGILALLVAGSAGAAEAPHAGVGAPVAGRDRATSGDRHGHDLAVLSATGAGVAMTGALSTGSLVLGALAMLLVAIAVFELLRPGSSAAP